MAARKKSRRAARRMLVQALYQAQLNGSSVDELNAQFQGRFSAQNADREYFCSLLQAVLDDTAALDAQINAHGEIEAEQLDPVERGILWLAMTELIAPFELPHRVVINEAIELAKTFGAEGGHRYVNAVLDKVVQST